jgi:hypothetical protein
VRLIRTRYDASVSIIVRLDAGFFDEKIGKTHESYTYSPAHATVHYRGRQTEPVASDSAGSKVK